MVTWGISCICQKMGRCLRLVVFSIVPVSPLRLEIKNLSIKPHHFRCLRSRLLDSVLLVSARNHVFFKLFSIFVYTLLTTLQMPGLTFIVVVGFQISSASLGCYVFSKNWCCMFTPPPPHLTSLFFGVETWNSGSWWQVKFPLKHVREVILWPWQAASWGMAIESLFRKVGTDLGEPKEARFSMFLLCSLDMQLGGTCRFFCCWADL